MGTVKRRTWNSPEGPKSAWQVTYTDGDGKRRSKQFARKKAADDYLTKVSAEVQQGNHTPQSQSPTVREAAELWLERKRNEDLEQTSYAAYEQHVRLHIIPLCGSKKLCNITKKVAEQVCDKLVQKLSRPMAVRVLRDLKSIVAAGAVPVAVTAFSDVSIKRARRGKSKVIISKKGEIKALIRVATMMENPMTLPLVLVLIFCDLRASEIRGLCWSSIDLKRNLLSVTERADNKGDVGEPKSFSGHRTIPLPTRVAAALREWKVRCPRTALSLVFPSERGKVMSHRYLTTNIFYPLQIMCGMFSNVSGKNGLVQKARYGLHAVRHAAASLWIERNVSPKKVQIWMGHASIAFTFDTYGHLFDLADQDATPANAIEDELMGYLDAAWARRAA